MHTHASYSLESEGGYVLHQPRVANFMDETGNITDPDVDELMRQV